MKKTIFILMAVVLGIAACNEKEYLVPTDDNQLDVTSVASIARPSSSFYTLSEVEATLIPYGVVESTLPSSYVPILSNYNQIKCYYDLATPEFIYYVYVVDDAENPTTRDGGPSPFISQWHNNENETGACYNPGKDCVFGGHYPDGETIIICNPDA